YWPQDQWIAVLVMLFLVTGAVLFPGFWARIAVFLGLLFGYLLSWLADSVFGKITSPDGTGEVTTHSRIDLSGLGDAAWFGLPDRVLADGINAVHGPSFSLTFILLALPGVIALIAENTGHVRAVGEMTGDDLDTYMGRALAADRL